MNKFTLILMLCFAFLFNKTLANDGVFYSRGGTLIPLQETQIRLKKELLKFFVRDFQFIDVEVNFEFYNPGKEKTVTVGFVTPPASGDIDEKKNHPRISMFTVNVNGNKVPHKVQRMSDSAFQANNRKIPGEDYVYYFPVTFKSGLNKVRHTYRFQGGGSVETQRDFDYQITTGKRWANKQIDDFELQIHLDRGIYYIPLSFREDKKYANWKIIGRGSFSKPKPALFSKGDPVLRFVQLQQGYLSLKQKNFKPDKDISFGEYNWNMGWHGRMCKSEKICPKVKELGNNLFQYFKVKPSKYFSEEMLIELSKHDLKIIRNFPYAIRGYEFKTRMLKRFYSQFFWYKPNKGIELSNLDLSDTEEDFVRKVLGIEKKK